MRSFTEQEIGKARQMDLLTYLKLNEPEQLVHVSGKTYSVREHSSLKISNGKWMWWSHGFGGYTALDYLIKVRCIPFPKAVAIILEQKPCQAEPAAGSREIHHKKLLLPEKNLNNDRVTRYLIGRGIHPKLIDACIEKGYLYESLPYHNCVFLGFDEDGIVRYAFYRSTNNERIMGEAAGSDKRWTFRVDSDYPVLHVFESAIDLLSYMTLEKIWSGKWPKGTMLSLGGIYVPSADPEKFKLPRSLGYKLDEALDITDIRLHLDNDYAGRNAANRMIKQLSSSHTVTYEPPRYGKDVNDELRFLLSQLKSEQKGMM